MKKRKQRNKYKAYEREKRRLRAQALTPAAYEAAIRALAQKLKI